MTHEPVTVSPASPASAARHLMAGNHVEHLPVVDEQRKLVGLVTERQLLEAPKDATCGTLMLAHPATVHADSSVIAALRLTSERSVSALPVVRESGALEGIITRGDLLRATYRLLGLDRAGSCIELALIDRVDDPVTALATLRETGIEPLSVVVGCSRDDGEEPALYVRVPQRTGRAAERALSRAGLVLLVPENQEHSREPLLVRNRETGDTTGVRRPSVQQSLFSEREPRSVEVMPAVAADVEKLQHVGSEVDSSVYLG
jgi:acetoin utilization protein AcuB